MTYAPSVRRTSFAQCWREAQQQKFLQWSLYIFNLIALDDIISKVLWTKRFVESQGFKVLLNVVYQDNTSTIKLAENGKASSGKRTRHFDIKYFYITDLIARDEVKIKHCPTEDMEADYMSKPTVGKKFSKFREIIMNLDTKS